MCVSNLYADNESDMDGKSIVRIEENWKKLERERKMKREDANSVKRIWKKQTVKIGAILVLAAGIGLGNFFYQTNYAVASTIWLNGNSGIEIKVNQNEKVLEVNAKDAAAQAIIGETDFRGSNLDVTVNALLGSMMRNGYLDHNTDSVMVRVECKDSDKEQKLQKELTEEVNELLQIDLFHDSTLNSTEFSHDHPYIAEQTDLNENTASYISEEEAKTAVFSHAGVSADTVFLEKCQLDYENGIMVYEIEFQSEGYEYDYDVNATTGEIISQKKEIHNHYVEHENRSHTAGNQSSGEIGEEQAKTAAFSHAGVSADNVWVEKCKKDYEDGIMVYEIEFYSEGYEYDYDINAVTGEVISFKKEMDTQRSGAESSGTGASASYISEAEAREIAVSYAGLSGASDLIVEIELDSEDGIMVYEIEIKSWGYEHKCEINAITGDVLSYEKEWDD